MPVKTPSLSSIGEIAEALGIPVHQAGYIARTRRIQPKYSWPNLKLYDHTAWPVFEKVLQDREARRHGR